MPALPPVMRRPARPEQSMPALHSRDLFGSSVMPLAGRCVPVGAKTTRGPGLGCSGRVMTRPSAHRRGRSSRATAWAWRVGLRKHDPRDQHLVARRPVSHERLTSRPAPVNRSAKSRGEASMEGRSCGARDEKPSRSLIARLAGRTMKRRLTRHPRSMSACLSRGRRGRPASSRPSCRPSSMARFRRWPSPRRRR
jgi:hypothetical protein